MKKIILSTFLILLLAFASGCGKQVQKETQPADTKPAASPVDSVGDDISGVDAIEKDLSTDDLSDLDTGLSDIENI